jgi:hypothetical protein
MWDTGILRDVPDSPFFLRVWPLLLIITSLFFRGIFQG